MSIDDKAKKPMQKRPQRRSSVDGLRDILTVEGKEDGFVYRIVNDEGGRVEAFEDIGYEVVTHDVKIGKARAGRTRGEPGSTHVINVGGGKKAVLMRQAQENYDEDQTLKAQRIKRTEDIMYNRDGQDYGSITVKHKKE
jgi:hypothetical protein